MARGVRGAKPPAVGKLLKNIDKNIKKCEFMPIFEGKNYHFWAENYNIWAEIINLSEIFKTINIFGKNFIFPIHFWSFL